jgi:hypothetical protein
MRAFAFLLALFSVSLAAQVPVATPQSKLAWDQGAASLPEAQALRYTGYLDASPTPIPLTAECAGDASPFTCITPIPTTQEGLRTIVVAANEMRSAPFSFLLQSLGISAPLNNAVLENTFEVRATGNASMTNVVFSFVRLANGMGIAPSISFPGAWNGSHWTHTIDPRLQGPDGVPIFVSGSYHLSVQATGLSPTPPITVVIINAVAWTGPRGLQGLPGDPGADSTVPGPEGPMGPAGTFIYPPERVIRANPVRGSGYVNLLQVGANERIRLKWLTVFSDLGTTVRLIVGQGSYCREGRANLSMAYPIANTIHTFPEMLLPAGMSLCMYQSAASAQVAGDGIAVVEILP